MFFYKFRVLITNKHNMPTFMLLASFIICSSFPCMLPRNCLYFSSVIGLCRPGEHTATLSSLTKKWYWLNLLMSNSWNMISQICKRTSEFMAGIIKTPFKKKPRRVSEILCPCQGYPRWHGQGHPVVNTVIWKGVTQGIPVLNIITVPVVDQKLWVMLIHRHIQTNEQTDRSK